MENSLNDTEAGPIDADASIRRYREDALARSIVDMCVAQAMREVRIDPERPERAASEAATRAAALAVQQYFEGNIGLKALEVERDMWKRQAIGGLNLASMSIEPVLFTK